MNINGRDERIKVHLDWKVTYIVLKPVEFNHTWRKVFKGESCVIVQSIYFFLLYDAYYEDKSHYHQENYRKVNL